MLQVFEYIQDYVLITNPQNKIIYCNKSFLKVLKYKSLEGYPLDSILIPNNAWLSKRAEQLDKTLLTFITEAKENIFVSAEILKNTLSDEEITIVIAHPLEDSYYTKADLEEILNHLPFHIWQKDTDFNYTYTNKSYTNWLIPNASSHELLGQPENLYWTPDVYNYFNRCDKEIIKTKQPILLEEVLGVSDEEIHSQTHKIPLLDTQGNVNKILGVASDILKTNRLEVELARASKQLNLLYDVANVSSIDSHTHIVLKHVGDFIIQHFNATGIILFEYDKLTQEFVVCSLNGNTPSSFTLSKRFSVNKEHLEIILQPNHLNAVIKIDEAMELIQSTKSALQEWQQTGITYVSRYLIKDGEELLGMLSIGYDTELKNVNVSDESLYTVLSQLHIVMKNISLVEAAQVEFKRRLVAEEQASNYEKVMQTESMKNEFFTNMSHELKTPINILLSTNELLNHYYANNKISTSEDIDFVKYTKIIKQNSYRLLRLVNNLIDTTRLDNEQYPLHLGIYNIVNIIEEITLSAAHYIQSKNINLIFDTNIEECFVKCDAEKIERIMLNLLSNAVKHTPENGHIYVTITSTSTSISVSIKDTGCGIPSDKLDLIFQRFGQVKPSSNYITGGSGIGLSLVYSLVQLHNGNIQVDSIFGEGSNFIFELPIIPLSFETDSHSILTYTAESHEKCYMEFSSISN